MSATTATTTPAEIIRGHIAESLVEFLPLEPIVLRAVGLTSKALRRAVFHSAVLGAGRTIVAADGSDAMFFPVEVKGCAADADPLVEECRLEYHIANIQRLRSTDPLRSLTQLITMINDKALQDKKAIYAGRRGFPMGGHPPRRAVLSSLSLAHCRHLVPGSLTSLWKPYHICKSISLIDFTGWNPHGASVLLADLMTVCGETCTTIRAADVAITAATTAQLILHCKALRHLVLSISDDFAAQATTNLLARRGQQLLSLSISGRRANDVLTAVAQYCNNLVKFDPGAFGWSLNCPATLATFKMFTHRNPNLNSMSLTMNTNVRDGTKFIEDVLASSLNDAATPKEGQTTCMCDRLLQLTLRDTGSHKPALQCFEHCSKLASLHVDGEDIRFVSPLPMLSLASLVVVRLYTNPLPSVDDRHELRQALVKDLALCRSLQTLDLSGSDLVHPSLVSELLGKVTRGLKCLILVGAEHRDDGWCDEALFGLNRFEQLSEIALQSLLPVQLDHQHGFSSTLLSVLFELVSKKKLHSITLNKIHFKEDIHLGMALIPGHCSHKLSEFSLMIHPAPDAATGGPLLQPSVWAAFCKLQRKLRVLCLFFRDPSVPQALFTEEEESAVAERRDAITGFILSLCDENGAIEELRLPEWMWRQGLVSTEAAGALRKSGISLMILS